MGPSRTFLVTLLFTLPVLFHSSPGHETSFKGIDVANPVIEVTPSPIGGHLYSHSKDVISCERVRIAGLSRLKLGSFASSFRVTLAPSVVIPERLHSKIQVCFHRNASLGLCQCDKDEWRGVQRGMWTSTMSPYEDRYVDVKFTGDVSGSVAVSVEEDFQRWRLLFLVSGLIILLLAPILSDWVPFYFCSSMVLGVLLVIIILLFQGMKLLPTGRKNAFYLTIYGSVIGIGSFILHQLSELINSILVSFGLSEEMHNPVYILVLVGVVLAGAALGYWIVRKYIISENGNVDVGIAQFMKWSMRIIAAALILQCSSDTPLAVATLLCCWAISSLVLSSSWHYRDNDSYYDTGSSCWWRSGKAVANHKRTEFLSRKVKVGPRGTLWNSPKNSPAFSDSPVKGLCSPSSVRGTIVRGSEQDHYSTFHKTPKRKKFSKKEWEEFTEESTQQAMAGLASSPEFTDWIIENAGRIKLVEDDGSDGSCRSGSDSTEEATVLSGNKINKLLKW